MLIKPIKKESEKFLRNMKGDLTVSNIIRYIESLGYNVIFYNTPNGDAVLEQYNLETQASLLKSFTYIKGIKYVFVNNDFHSADKIYLLLHELGHILLGHLNGNAVFLEHNFRLDNEAEAFVYFVLNHRKRNFLLHAAAILLLIAVAFFVYISNTRAVYITRSGESFHRSSCISIQGKRTALMERSAAQKIFDPCKICNP